MNSEDNVATSTSDLRMFTPFVDEVKGNAKHQLEVFPMFPDVIRRSRI